MANYQPYPQHQQHQQYPPPQRSNKVFTIVFSVVVVLIVLGGGAYIVSQFTGGSDDSAGTTTAPPATRATDDASTRPTEAPTTSAPTTSGAGCRGCIPGLTVDGLVKQLKPKGFACKDHRILGMQCEKGKLEFTIQRVYKQKNQVESIDIGGRATGSGSYPQGPGEAHAALQAGLPGMLAIFITDAAVRQQIIAFVAKNTAHAATGPDAVRGAKVGNFRLSCHGVSGATVGKNGRSSSSYATSVDISSSSAY